MSSVGPTSWPPADPGSPVPPGTDQRSGPGAAGYWVGGILMVLGVALAVVMMVVGAHRVGQFFRFPTEVDSSGQVTLSEPGDYVVFVIDQAPSQSDQFGSSTVSPPVSVRSPSGDLVATTKSASQFSFGGNRVATSVATFHADRAGDYTVSGSPLGPAESLGVARRAKVEPQQLALGFFGAAILFLTGVVVLIVTAVRRRPPPPPQPIYFGPPGYPGIPVTPVSQVTPASTRSAAPGSAAARPSSGGADPFRASLRGRPPTTVRRWPISPPASPNSGIDGTPSVPATPTPAPRWTR